MLNPSVRFISSTRRAVIVDEPSHIHIARPSSVLARAHTDASVKPAQDVRDPAAQPATVTVQAA